MKKIVSLTAALLLFGAASVALAHDATIAISSPSDQQTITVESLPVNIIVEGTITHGSPGTINDQRACVSVDGGTPVCEPSYVGGLGRATSRNYSITVTTTNAGQHTLQAFTANSNGDHSGVSALITINIVLNAACDEKDPPAYANEYLDSLRLPQNYATYRGQIIRVIALNSSNGAYGSCHFDYELVRADVDTLLSQLGF